MPEGSALPNPLPKIILLIVLIALNALFAMSEIAVISFNDNKLKHLAQQGNKKAKVLLRLTSEPSKFLATIQVGVTLSGLLSSAVAADTFTDYIVYWMRNINIPTSVVRMISLIVITMILAYVNLVFGELVPKRIAMNNPEKVSFGVSGILNVTSIITKPFVALLSKSTNGILRLIGIDPDKEDNDVTEEEIRMMIDVGEEDGTINVSERDMLHNIFEFSDLTADEVMTHRTEIIALDIASSLSETVSNAIDNGHTRMPVYEGSLDNIVGLLNIKDLLPFVVQNDPDFTIRSFMRPAMYVPESARCSDIFEQFRTTKYQLAVVVDEYGGTAGIVTMEDLLESIVGNIQDEYDEEPDDIRRLADGEYVLDGTTDLDDVAYALGIKFHDAHECETIAGLVTELLRHLPEESETVEYGGYLFTVTAVGEHRVLSVHAKKKPEPDEQKAGQKAKKEKD